MNLFWYF